MRSGGADTNHGLLELSRRLVAEVVYRSAADYLLAARYGFVARFAPTELGAEAADNYSWAEGPDPRRRQLDVQLERVGCITRADLSNLCAFFGPRLGPLLHSAGFSVSDVQLRRRISELEASRAILLTHLRVD